MDEPKKAEVEKSTSKPEGEEVNTPDTTPVAEPEASEEVSEPEIEAEPTGAEEIEAEETETGGKVERKGFTKRVKELSGRAKKAEARAKKAEAELQSLSGKVAELTGRSGPSAGVVQPTMLPREEPIVAPGEEITASELDRRIKAREQRLLQQIDTLAQLRNKQGEIVNQINSDATEAMTNYPELDPESKSFNRELSDSVTAAVEAHVRANPYGASVKKIVDKLMKPYKGAVTKEVGKVTGNLAKQVSETALRPTAVKSTGKSADDKSPEELEKELGVVF